MTLEEYLEQLERKQFALLCECVATQNVERARMVLAWWDVAVCSSPNTHRKEFAYLGNNVFICNACRRLAHGMIGL